jgi:Zn-dependent protease with chaperone function
MKMTHKNFQSVVIACAFVVTQVMFSIVQAKEFAVEGQTIKVKQPKGFVALDHSLQEYQQGMLLANSLGIELLEFYLSESDAANALMGDENEDGRTILLGYQRRQNSNMSLASFTELKDSHKLAIENGLSEEDKKYVRQLLDDSQEFFTDIVKIDTNETKQLHLGITDESPRSISWSTFLKSAVQYEDEYFDFVQANTMVLVLVKGKLIFLKVSSLYTDAQHLEWTRRVALEILNDIIQNNPSNEQNTDFEPLEKTKLNIPNPETSLNITAIIIPLILIGLAIFLCWKINENRKFKSQSFIDLQLQANYTAIATIALFIITIMAELIFAWTTYDDARSASSIAFGLHSINLASFEHMAFSNQKSSLLNLLLIVKSIGFIAAFLWFVRKHGSLQRYKTSLKLKTVDAEMIPHVEELFKQLVKKAGLEPIPLTYWISLRNGNSPSIFKSEHGYNLVVPLGFSKLVRENNDVASAMLAHEVGHIVQGDVALWKLSILSSMIFSRVIVPSYLVVLIIVISTGSSGSEYISQRWVFILLLGLIHFLLYRIILVARRHSEDMADYFAANLVGIAPLKKAIENYTGESKSNFHKTKQKRLNDVAQINVKSKWHAVLWLYVLIAVMNILSLPTNLEFYKDISPLLIYMHAAFSLVTAVLLSIRHSLGFITLIFMLLSTQFLASQLPHWRPDMILFSILGIVLITPSFLLNFGKRLTNESK